MPVCPEGHTSSAADYCDVCGAAVAPSCPTCGAPISGRFCESCGHDSTQPAPTASAQTVPVVWAAVVDADRDYYQRVLARGGPDTVEFPAVFPARRITLRRKTTLIGRHNRAQGVEPEIDLGIHPIDRGVSTQHAVLRIRETGVTITDLGSTNGTSLNDSDDLLQMDEEVALTEGDRVHVGAWTTITIRQIG